MRVKLVLPALTEAQSPFYRPIKYSLFPPLGLATLAAYLREDDEIEIADEHVSRLRLDDRPDIVAIETYITNAHRAYALADHYRRHGSHVVLGGLHATSLPEEAARHADTICLGPGEDSWPGFLSDFRNSRPAPIYRSHQRTLAEAPFPRHDLIHRERYLAPNSTVVSRGCRHACDFCYKSSFFAGGRGFYTHAVDRALAEIERLPPRHLYFLDDHLFADPRFSEALCDGMRGMGRIWQAAGTVDSVLQPNLMEKASAVGLRSLFVGFETLNPVNLRIQRKWHNRVHDYDAAVRRLHDLGVMINASFVFGMDDDDESVFDRTVEWAIERGIETATFHILTPYPGTALFRRLMKERRILHHNWDLYDTRHAVFEPRLMTTEALEAGYWRSYREFYRWGSILRAATTKDDPWSVLRHVALTGAWKKLEWVWSVVIRARLLPACLPILEHVLAGSAAHPGKAAVKIIPADEVAERL